MDGGLVLPLFELVVFRYEDILKALALGGVAKEGLYLSGNLFRIVAVY